MQHLVKKKLLSQREDERPVKKVEKRKSSGNSNLELLFQLQQNLLSKRNYEVVTSLVRIILSAAKDLYDNSALVFETVL